MRHDGVNDVVAESRVRRFAPVRLPERPLGRAVDSAKDIAAPANWNPSPPHCCNTCLLTSFIARTRHRSPGRREDHHEQQREEPWRRSRPADGRSHDGRPADRGWCHQRAADLVRAAAATAGKCAGCGTWSPISAPPRAASRHWRWRCSGWCWCWPGRAAGGRHT